MKRIKAISKVSNMYSKTDREQAINETRQALIAGEQSGFTKLSVADIHKEARAELNLDCLL
jgi:hypothetical protein